MGRSGSRAISLCSLFMMLFPPHTLRTQHGLSAEFRAPECRYRDVAVIAPGISRSITVYGAASSWFLPDVMTLVIRQIRTVFLPISGCHIHIDARWVISSARLKKMLGYGWEFLPNNLSGAGMLYSCHHKSLCLIIS